LNANTSNISTVPDNNIYNANMPNRGNVNMMNNNHIIIVMKAGGLAL